MVREKHFTNRSGWLRASVLGANDGILSTASIAIGVAAASDLRNPIVLASLAGLVAGGLSMAAGEYVSVSSQVDIETADLKREQEELEKIPEIELTELANIYIDRGLDEETAKKVAVQLTEHNALESHARDELGINEITRAKPLQAAFASGASFITGAMLPMLVSLFMPLHGMVIYQYVCATLFLVGLGALAARAGGSHIGKAIGRITFWGTVAMGATALVGTLFNMNFG
jgi:VIT1/CCC1 family predicted Fe2+/Mn2+ transporter